MITVSFSVGVFSLFSLHFMLVLGVGMGHVCWFQFRWVAGTYDHIDGYGSPHLQGDLGGNLLVCNDECIIHQPVEMDSVFIHLVSQGSGIIGKLKNLSEKIILNRSCVGNCVGMQLFPKQNN